MKEVSETNCLRAMIDKEMKWKKNIQYSSKKIPKRIDMVTLYYSFIYLYVAYCNQLRICSASKNKNFGTAEESRAHDM